MKKAQVLALIITVILIVLLFNLDITQNKEETKGYDAKIQLAIEKVKGQNPMEGIMMLKEIF